MGSARPLICIYVHALVATGVVRNARLIAADLATQGHAVQLVTALGFGLSAFVLLAAGPALAGERGGGGPPPGPCCGHPGGGHPGGRPPGGGATNINVNVNASAHARASAAASARSSLNARAYDVGGIRGRGYGGTVYTGGGYGGDVGGYGYGYGGGPVYHEIDPRVLACGSAPFGYVVNGFGRHERRPSSCGGYREVSYGYGEDRGGRYGYSEYHEAREARFYESYEYQGYEYGGYEDYDGYRDHDRGDCDCRPHEPAPYPPAYLPEPPRYQPPARAHRPAPPRRSPPPRQQYRQDPGERG